MVEALTMIIILAFVALGFAVRASMLKADNAAHVSYSKQLLTSVSELTAENATLSAESATDHDIIASLRAQIAAFDHDGDGKAGGSKPRASATRRALEARLDAMKAGIKPERLEVEPSDYGDLGPVFAGMTVEITDKPGMRVVGGSRKRA